MQNNIQKILLQALDDHKNGRLKNAESIYRIILADEPNHPDANHNLGVLMVAEGNLLLAIKLFKKAVAINPSFEQFWHSYIYTLIKCGQIDDAQKSFSEADKLGISSKRLSALRERLMSRVQNKNPNTNIKPPQSQLDNLSVGFQKKNFIHVEKMAKSIIQEYPNHPYAWKILAGVLEKLDRLEEAILNYQKVASLTTNDITVYQKLGSLLIRLGKPKEAIENFKKIISIKPDNFAAYNDIGVSLQALGKLDESLEFFKKAIDINPEYVESLNNLGNIFRELGRFDQAIEHYKKAIDLKPDYAKSLNNFGRLLMLKSNFKKAFELMEWRLKLEELNFTPLESSNPRWEGKRDQKVFLLKEQGVGDYIMFSSMIPELETCSDKLLVECDHRLLPIFQRSFSKNIKYITDRRYVSDNDYDYNIPIGSLPLHFRKDLHDFQKSSKGWIKADPERVQNIKQNIIQNKSKKIVGVSWKTSSLLNNAHLRNIDLATLLKPLKNLDLIFVNLQYGDVSKEIFNLQSEHGIKVLEMAELDLFVDIDGLVALISACDCIISIDNLNPHFAGALGVKTKLLLPKVADERWGLEPSKSYLYDSVALYRQSSYNNWNEPLKKIKTYLENL